MKSNTTDIKTPLSVAKGMGSAKSGTGHFMAQRLTAIANIGLVLWVIYNIVSLIANSSADPEVSFAQARAWVAEPVTTVLLILFIMNVFYHAALGLQVVIEDYMHKPLLKYVTLIAVRFLSFALAISAVVAVLRIAFI